MADMLPILTNQSRATGLEPFYHKRGSFLLSLLIVDGLPRTDGEGAEELSKAVGTATFEARTESRSGTIAESRIVTANTQWQAGDSRALVRERLITPDELMTLGTDRQYVIAASKDVPRDALHIHHARYWLRPDACGLADPNPFVLRKQGAETAYAGKNRTRPRLRLPFVWSSNQRRLQTPTEPPGPAVFFALLFLGRSVPFGLAANIGVEFLPRGSRFVVDARVVHGGPQPGELKGIFICPPLSLFGRFRRGGLSVPCSRASGAAAPSFGVRAAFTRKRRGSCGRTSRPRFSALSCCRTEGVDCRRRMSGGSAIG